MPSALGDAAASFGTQAANAAPVDMDWDDEDEKTAVFEKSTHEDAARSLLRSAPPPAAGAPASGAFGTAAFGPRRRRRRAPGELRWRSAVLVPAATGAPDADVVSFAPRAADVGAGADAAAAARCRHHPREHSELSAAAFRWAGPRCC